jgi:hypothetical protein
MNNVIKILQDERAVVAHRLSQLDAAIKALGHEVAVKVKRTISAAARAKMSAAQKKRWAAKKSK